MNFFNLTSIYLYFASLLTSWLICSLNVIFSSNVTPSILAFVTLFKSTPLIFMLKLSATVLLLIMMYDVFCKFSESLLESIHVVILFKTSAAFSDSVADERSSVDLG